MSGIRSTVGSDCNVSALERSTLNAIELVKGTQPAKLFTHVILPQKYTMPRKLNVSAGKSVELAMKVLDESF